MHTAPLVRTSEHGRSVQDQRPQQPVLQSPGSPHFRPQRTDGWMEEEHAVYVIRLRQGSPDGGVLAKGRLPSEHRYSAKLVKGLGCIHLALGMLSAVFSVMALSTGTGASGQVPAGALGSGLWSGAVYASCGVAGILAATRWYKRHQILAFFVASVLAFAASLACIIASSIGVHARGPPTPDVPPSQEVPGWTRAASVIVANIFLTSLAEMLLAIPSIHISFKGWVSEEYCFTPTTATADSAGAPGGLISLKQTRRLPLAVILHPSSLGSDTERSRFSPPGGGSSPSNNQEGSQLHRGGGPKASGPGLGMCRREFILETSLPIGYTRGSSDTWWAPDLLCHLTNPKTSQYHVTRINPLGKGYYCQEMADENLCRSPSVASLPKSSMSDLPSCSDDDDDLGSGDGCVSQEKFNQIEEDGGGGLQKALQIPIGNHGLQRHYLQEKKVQQFVMEAAKLAHQNTLASSDAHHQKAIF